MSELLNMVFELQAEIVITVLVVISIVGCAGCAPVIVLEYNHITDMSYLKRLTL